MKFCEDQQEGGILTVVRTLLIFFSLALSYILYPVCQLVMSEVKGLSQRFPFELWAYAQPLLCQLNKRKHYLLSYFAVDNIMNIF